MSVTGGPLSLSGQSQGKRDTHNAAVCTMPCCHGNCQEKKTGVEYRAFREKLTNGFPFLVEVKPKPVSLVCWKHAVAKTSFW